MKISSKSVFTGLRGNILGVVLCVVNVAVDIGCYFLKEEKPGGLAYAFDDEPTIFQWFIRLNKIPSAITGWIFSPFTPEIYSSAHWQLAFWLVFLAIVCFQWLIIGYLITRIALYLLSKSRRK